MLKLDTSSALHCQKNHKTSNFLRELKDVKFIDYCYGKNTARDDEVFFLNQGLTLPEKLTTAIAKRRLEFLAGRFCAQAALAGLGIGAQDTLEISQSKAPKWPTGVIGSITHTKNYAAAVVGKSTTWQGLGIDSEVIVEDSKPTSLIKHVCIDGEFEKLARDYEMGISELFTLIFSAKESLFKAINPIVNKFFGFKGASLDRLSPEEGSFIVRLQTTLSPGFQAGYEYKGYYTTTGNRIMTYVFIRNSQ